MKPPSGTTTRKRPRWMIPAIVLGAAGLLVVLVLLVIYPRVGAWMIRGKLGDRLATKLGREVRFGDVEVHLGHATLRDLEIHGPNDGDTPLVHIDRLDIEFDTLRSFVGSVKLGEAAIDGIVVNVRRDANGKDNLGDIIERVVEQREAAAGQGPAGGKLRPTSLTVKHVRVLVDDALTGATGLVADGTASWKPGELTAQARQVSATTLNAPKATANLVEVTKVAGQPPHIRIEGGELSVWPKLALSGITGTVIADPKHPGTYTLDMAGGYGGVPGKLWTAKGAVDLEAQKMNVDLVAAKFQLDRLAPLLQESPVVDYATTSVDTSLHIEADRNGGTFAGKLTLRGLNVGHPMIADKEVHDLDLSAQIEGSFDRAEKKLELVRGDFIARDVPFSVTGSVTRVARSTEVVIDPETGKPIAGRGPGGINTLKARLVIPSIDCQKVLNAIPVEMAPYLAGYKLTGMFDTDVVLEVDWANLDATKLDGHVGIRHCKVRDEPADSPKRLKEEFEHYVEVEKGQWVSFVVGPSNDDFVPLDQISPYVIKSIMSTEDSAFYQHHGFITSEFRTALVRNLKAGAFKFGASSITMQFVKNVLLYREKTLARKLQELFLTWHVENTLTKDRIMEIYLNVIEYGPGLYGIGPASWHFFSKPPKDLNPVEAAFFSTILPSPKERYKQYCAGTLTKWTTGKIQRILNIMRKRERLTQVEYDAAMATPLLFAKDNSESEEDCMKRVTKAIKNSRSTNPMKR